MIKLKDILSEAYAWERQEGKSLPTLAEVQAAYDARMREEAKPDFLDLDNDGDEEESMKSAANDADDDKDPEPEKWNASKLTKDKDLPEPYKYDPYGDDDDDDDYYMDEASKPDFLDLDGDGEIESGSEEYLGSRDKAIKAALKNEYGGQDSDRIHADGPKNKYSDVREKEQMSESFNKRMLGNLHGHEYILREAFKRK